MNKYNKYHESLIIDCCDKEKKPKARYTNCCPPPHLPSRDNEIEVLIRQLKREVKELMKSTEFRLLCQNKKIDETMVYIKNNLSNAIRNLLDSMLQSGELDEIITDIIAESIEELEGEVEAIKTDVAGVKTQITGLNHSVQALQTKDSQIDEALSKKTNLDELDQKRLQSKYSTYGMFEKGVGVSAIINDEDGRPQIMGMVRNNQVAEYSNRDAVGFYVNARPSVPLINYNEGDTTFTATSVTLPSLDEDTVNKLAATDLTDTVIDTYNVTGETFVRYSALVESFHQTDNTFVIKGGWYAVPSDGSETYTPEDGLGVYLGLCTKVWGLNTVVELPADGTAMSSTGYELEVRNHKAQSQDNTILDLIGSPDIGGDYAIQSGIKIRGKASDQQVRNAINYNNISYAVLNGTLNDGSEKYIILNRNDNDEITYFLKSNGNQIPLGYDQQLITNISTPCNIFAGYKAFNIAGYNGATYTFLNPKYLLGKIFLIQNIMPQDLVLGYINGGNVADTRTIPAKTSKFIFSDGYAWTIVS
ncbi:MAG: hypothetical protein J6T10_16580 [Methanobrevibacter sp.]|nr:hypothetical protein [Methanobrevibacter sp.]